VQAKAAAVMHSLVCHHALRDGNKRLGLLATAVFLRVNGLDLALDEAQAFELTINVAAGQFNADDIEKRLLTRPARR
jgi:death-on-curing protein